MLVKSTPRVFDNFSPGFALKPWGKTASKVLTLKALANWLGTEDVETDERSKIIERGTGTPQTESHCSRGGDGVKTLANPFRVASNRGELVSQGGQSPTLG